MLAAVVVVAALALVFDLSNGFHDSSNSIAALVATHAARPRSALALAATFHLAGPLLGGVAVADTVGGVVRARTDLVVPVVGAALTAGLLWNVLTWLRGLPSSSSHALVGGLVGATAAADGWHAVRWGGADLVHPRGVGGIVIGLAVSPLLGLAAGWAVARLLRQVLVRGRARAARWVRRAEWLGAATLAFSHGSNDAQKTMGVLTLVLLASGHLTSFVVPLWVVLAAAAALTVGTAFGGWRIIRTVGRGIYRLQPVDGLASQLSSAAVILGAAQAGAPVSTTHVVSMSVVGVGAAQRVRHVHWDVVRAMAEAWLVTLPLSAALAALALPAWEVWAR